jgi:hypothetical protein
VSEPGSGYVRDEFGWNDADQTNPGVLRTVLLVLATTGYYGWLWLLRGLPPVAFVAGRFASTTPDRHQNEIS